MQDSGSTVSFCPSFNSYSSDRLADIAAEVGKEEANDTVHVFRNQNDSESSYSDEDDDDFEFVLVRENPYVYTTTDGDHNVEFPIFPVFDRDLLLKSGTEAKDQSQDQKSSTVGLSLKNLFIEDRDPSSSSSSEADELDGILPETYCIWTPQKASPSNSPSRCKKSNSTGSSSKQRWRLRDLLHLRRSSSDGKESFICCNPDHHQNNKNNINLWRNKDEKIDTYKRVQAKAGKSKEKISAHEVFYVRNKALKEGDKRKSYLPYRQELVGFFANVNGLSRNFSPF